MFWIPEQARSFSRSAGSGNQCRWLVNNCEKRCKHKGGQCVHKKKEDVIERVVWLGRLGNLKILNIASTCAENQQRVCRVSSSTTSLDISQHCWSHGCIWQTDVLSLVLLAQPGWGYDTRISGPAHSSVPLFPHLWCKGDLQQVSYPHREGASHKFGKHNQSDYLKITVGLLITFLVQIWCF